MKHLLLTAIFCVISTASQAQDLLITNATLHTMGKAGVVQNADILIKHGKIERIAKKITPHHGIEVIDAAGQPVTPAFFAGITSAGLSEVEMVYEAVDSEYKELYTDLMHPEFDVRTAYNPHSSVVPITRVEGFGYTLLGATRGDRTISGQGGMVRFDGGYSSFEGKSAVFVELSGYAAEQVGGSRAVQWMLLQEAFAEMNSDEANLLSPMGKKALKKAAKESVFVFNTHRAADIVQVLKFVDQHNLSAVINGGREAWMVAPALAEARVPVILNSLDNLPADFDSLGARMDNAALLHQAGVSILFSSGETHNSRKVRQLAGNAVSYGLPHDVALAAMTVTPANVFGGGNRVLSVGAAADLVIWSGDPLEVTTVAAQVVMGGIPDTMQSRQTKLRDRYLPQQPDMPRAYIKP